MNQRRRRSAPPAAAPLDNDDLLTVILLRLPPQPSSLPRAGFVCKRWRRIVTDPRFVRDFRAHHRVPPLLGVFLISGLFIPAQDPPCRAPPMLSSLDPSAGQGPVITWRLLGCRHGLALTVTTRMKFGFRFKVITEFGVFDPMTGDLSRVLATGTIVTAAVVAVAGGTDRRRSFRLVALCSNDERTGVTASVYSSDSGAWVDSVATMLTPPHVALFDHPSTLVGNAIYWLLDDGQILLFELGRQSLAMVEQPPQAEGERWSRAMSGYSRWIMPAREEGHFGLAILSGLSIQFWEREAELSSAATWMLCKTVELDRVLPLQLKEHMSPLWIIGFAEENNVIFISTHDAVFMIHIETMQFKKVPIIADIKLYIHPYSSF